MNIFVTIAALLTAVPAFADEPERTKIELADEGFVGDFYLPPTEKPTLGVLVLGGSEGGKPRFRASMFAREGFPVLALAYFKTKGTPSHLDMIPLEYFDKPIRWLAEHPQVRDQKIVVVGGSKGGELALLLASRHPEISGVIAVSPSSVVFQGIPKIFWPPRSSWSFEGKGVPYVPYDYSQGFDQKDLRALYELSLKQKEAVEQAAIPVERINGPILLLTGREDAMWPAAEMCESICARLKAEEFPHGYEHIAYKAAGHTLHERALLGGTKEGNLQARVDSEERMFKFLKSLENQFYGER